MRGAGHFCPEKGCTPPVGSVPPAAPARIGRRTKAGGQRARESGTVRGHQPGVPRPPRTGDELEWPHRVGSPRIVLAAPNTPPKLSAWNPRKRCYGPLRENKSSKPRVSLTTVPGVAQGVPGLTGIDWRWLPSGFKNCVSESLVGYPYHKTNPLWKACFCDLCSE